MKVRQKKKTSLKSFLFLVASCDNLRGGLFVIVTFFFARCPRCAYTFFFDRISPSCHVCLGGIVSSEALYSTSDGTSSVNFVSVKDNSGRVFVINKDNHNVVYSYIFNSPFLALFPFRSLKIRSIPFSYVVVKILTCMGLLF